MSKNTQKNSKVVEKNPLDFKLSIKCKNQTQKKLINSIKDNYITICSGPAGTGKTFLACAQSLIELKNGNFDKIVIVKSVTPIKDEEVGFLKGDLKEKMEPYMYSFMDNFNKAIGEENVNRLVESGYIQNIPITYMRGINIDNSIIIIDETQNLTRKKIITILTRLGDMSKMVFLGDVDQIDMRNPNESGLSKMIDDFSDISGFGTVRFIEDDCVRHKVVQDVLNREKKLKEKE